MKGFLAITLAAVAAAQATTEVDVSVIDVDVEFQADMAVKRDVGAQYVDELVEDPYSLSGMMDFH